MKTYHGKPLYLEVYLLQQLNLLSYARLQSYISELPVQLEAANKIETQVTLWGFHRNSFKAELICPLLFLFF